MENTKSELQHNDVRKEDFFSETYYFNEVEFYNEFDILIFEYDFLLDIDNYREDIPKDALDRYNIFKKSVARYYFLHYLQEYKDLTLRSEIKSVVAALHQEYLQMENNPKLKKTHSDYYPIYLKATRFIKEFVDKGNDVILNYSKEDVETMLYLLHREDYFKDFPIPDDAFDVNSYSNPYAIIAEVYAKYFLFRDFIKGVYDKLITVDGANTPAPLLRQPEPINIPESAKINSESRSIADLINPAFKAKYDKILLILSEKNPLGKVVTNLPISKRIELLSLKSELKNFQNKLVYQVENERIFVDVEYKSLKTFLVHLFAYMITMKWMFLAENYSTTCQIIGNSIFNKDDENGKISFDRAQLNGIVIKLESKQLTVESNSYLKFINLIVSNI